MVNTRWMTASALPDVPNANYNATARLRMAAGAATAAADRAEAAYVGRTWLTFDRGSPTTGAYSTARSSPNWRLDAGACRRSWTNPGNSSADTFAYGNPFSLGETRQVTPLRRGRSASPSRRPSESSAERPPSLLDLGWVPLAPRRANVRHDPDDHAIGQSIECSPGAVIE